MEGPAEPLLPPRALAASPMLPWLIPPPTPFPRHGQSRWDHRGDEHGRLGDVVLLTVVGLLKAAFDGDDPLWAGHLELQVGVVGDGLELGEARLTEEGVVEAREVDNLEGE